MIDLTLLNEHQKEAVVSDEPYLRIIAGAGSGKTRLLTMRIAHLIEDEDVRPGRILAITFTNKAAKEMKSRISDMIDQDGAQPWISTIHSLCVRILREDINSMGYPKNFTIMDADDQKSLVKEAFKNLKMDTDDLKPSTYVSYISNNKTAEISVEAAFKMANHFRDDEEKAEVYRYYMERQKQMYALDFDDLILFTVKMFRQYPKIRQKWQRHFEYILVDEFQDIDRLQYRLIRQLCADTTSLYVVGDPDQTIYTWRGADVNIIMNYAKDFPNAKTVILNENYRSSKYILQAANSVIVNNKNRMEKDLYTSRKDGEKIVHFNAASDEYEAAWVAEQISRLHAQGLPYRDIAILYRSNYLSRSMERGLVDLRIPYIIYGGIRFYERQEIKDALCYLRMVSSSDDLALQRVLNRPKRGIGARTMDAIAAQAHRQDTSMYEILKQNQIFTGKIKAKIEDFVSMVERWKAYAQSEGSNLVELMSLILRDSGYRAMVLEDQEKGEERLENLKSLTDDLRAFEENDPNAGLDEYLQTISLYTDKEEREQADAVQMMTVHSAKGLEFDTVFVVDLNESIFPNERAATESRRGIEEERRLAYVAFTRAKRKLYLVEAGGYSYILQKPRTTSRFIREIDPDCFEKPKETITKPAAGSETSETSRAAGSKPAGRMVKKGDHVHHDRFGDGIVINVTGGIAQIAFPYPAGVKKIAAAHPALKKIAKEI
ncbi:MAG: ATP-dependent helicase [Bulleidia sp.]